MKLKTFLINLFTKRALIIILKTLDYNAIIHLVIQAKTGHADVSEKQVAHHVEEAANAIDWAVNIAKEIPVNKHK